MLPLPIQVVLISYLRPNENYTVVGSLLVTVFGKQKAQTEGVVMTVAKYKTCRDGLVLLNPVCRQAGEDSGEYKTKNLFTKTKS